MGGAGSGIKVELDTETLYDLGEMGLTQEEAAGELGICRQTLSKKIVEIQEHQGILVQYRALQSLQLTSLQARILDAVTPDKINDAPLRDLVLAFKVLKTFELTLEGKPSEIKGLIAYLIELEKEEAALDKPIDVEALEEMEEVVKDITDPDYLPVLREE